MELKRVIKVTGNDLEMDVLSRKNRLCNATSINNFYNAQMSIDIYNGNLHSFSLEKVAFGQCTKEGKPSHFSLQQRKIARNQFLRSLTHNQLFERVWPDKEAI